MDMIDRLLKQPGQDCRMAGFFDFKIFLSRGLCLHKPPQLCFISTALFYSFVPPASRALLPPQLDGSFLLLLYPLRGLI
jgi:hypothetical protein